MWVDGGETSGINTGPSESSVTTQFYSIYKDRRVYWGKSLCAWVYSSYIFHVIILPKSS